MLELAALIIGTSMTALIALVVFAKNSRSATNKLFILLAAGLVGWSITTYFSLHTSSDAESLLWIRWIMFFVVIQNTAFFFLVKIFRSNSFAAVKNNKYRILMLFSVATAAVAVSPYLFVDFKNGSPMPGPGMALFLPHALLTAAGGLIALFLRYKRAIGSDKVQLQYFFAGTLLMYTLVPAGNFIVPVVLGANELVQISPLYSIIFSGLIAYAIVAKRMFDVRVTIARAVTYLLLLATLATLYGAGVFGVVKLLFDGSLANTTQSIVYSTAAVFLAFTFAPLKDFFARFTNKIFFRDIYDTKLVLDGITSVLVHEVSADQLTKKSLQILKDALKSESITVAIVHQSGHRVIGVGTRPNVKPLLDKLATHPEPLLVLDALDSQGQVAHEMRTANVAVVARLETSKELIGYAFFGYKESGDTYSQQDADLIRIAMDEVAVAIQNTLRFEEIASFNETLKQNVKDATSELRTSNTKLKRLDESKDEFISMASHQLRTPLTSIKGYISMVLDGDMGEITPQQRKVLEEAFASSQRMVYLIGDFLNVSRIQTGKFMLERSPVHIASIITDEIDQVRATAAAKSIKITYDAPREFPVLELDENKIRQVMMNFIDNAIYYSPPDTTIRVSIVKHKDDIEFKVDDQGIGVPKSEQQQLFTKFYRASNARKQRPDGTGIGLFMAKKVIVAHGGSIIFATHEGKGSTFGFKLPLTATLLSKSVRTEATPQPVR